jgi:NAD+ synthase (glutamine-hydrolysing)
MLTGIDMGMTYQELTIFGRLRKLNKLGPFGMFQRLVHDWSIDRERKPDDDAPYYTPAQVAEKVKKFFHFYAINRTFFLCCLERVVFAF